MSQVKTKNELIEEEHSRARVTGFFFTAVLWIISICISLGFLETYQTLNSSEETSIFSYIYIWVVTIVAAIHIGNFYSVVKRHAGAIHRRQLKNIERNFEDKEE